MYSAHIYPEVKIVKALIKLNNYFIFTSNTLSDSSWARKLFSKSNGKRRQFQYSDLWEMYYIWSSYITVLNKAKVFSGYLCACVKLYSYFALFLLVLFWVTSKQIWWKMWKKISGTTILHDMIKTADVAWNISIRSHTAQSHPTALKQPGLFHISVFLKYRGIKYDAHTHSFHPCEYLTLTFILTWFISWGLRAVCMNCCL